MVIASKNWPSLCKMNKQPKYKHIIFLFKLQVETQDNIENNIMCFLDFCGNECQGCNLLSYYIDLKISQNIVN